MPEDSEDWEEEDDSFPWEDVDASRENKRLQARHPQEKGKRLYLGRAAPCPDCRTPAERLSWLYFESPDWTWQNLCGRAGWMVVCDRCRRQVNFFCEVMN